jgi:hypothetical protein
MRATCSKRNLFRLRINQKIKAMHNNDERTSRVQEAISGSYPGMAPEEALTEIISDTMVLAKRLRLSFNQLVKIAKDRMEAAKVN